MKLIKSITIAILSLCLALGLAACGGEEPAITTAPTNQPTVPTTAPPDPADLYAAALQAVQAAPDLTLTYTYGESREVGGETYTESRTGTASYLGRGTDAMEALVSEELTYGSYSTQYTESYLSGIAYCQFRGSIFQCGISGEEFLSLQLPAVLLDPALYGSITAETDDTGTSLTFTDPTLAENWLALAPQAELIAASGSAVLDASGSLTNTSYHAEYTVGTTRYALDVTVEISLTAPVLTAQPDYPENCPTLSDLRIPRYLLRTVGDVYTARNMSASYSDTLYMEAFAQIRTQVSSYDTYGSGDGFMAALSSQVSVTDYAGNVSANSQTVTYRDGVCTNSVNGGTPTTDSSSAEQVRSLCENSILSALLAPESIAAAELTDTGDFLCIRFTGSEAFAESICGSIYTLLQVDLDNWADSYTTDAVGGYLTVNKHTGLPTAMGMQINRTHVKDQVPYRLTYQQDQALTLSSPDAYKNITGENAPEAPAEESASPLFYKVTGADGQTMWLLGTIHAGDSRTASLPQQLLDAFAASDALAVEFDTNAFGQAALTDPALQAQIAHAYYYTSGTTQDNLSKELYARLYPLMLASGSNSYSSPYLKIAVWENLLENLYLRQSYTLTADKGMDQRLLTWAAAQEKTVYEIESGLSQLKMLTGFSKKLQTMLLEDLLDTGLLTYSSLTQQLYELWCGGDEAALAEALTEDTSGMTEDERKLYEEYYKAMYTDRNSVMLNAAKEYLESGETVFYAVGLAHLLGEDGLVEALRAEGYTVEQVQYS